MWIPQRRPDESLRDWASRVVIAYNIGNEPVKEGAD